MCNRILSIIYFQLFCHIKSQWLDIWFEDGTTATESEWTQSDGGYFYFDYNTAMVYDDACATGTCILFWPWGQNVGDFVDQFIYRTTDITSYSQLRLKYDLTTHSMEASDACQISYTYDTETAKTLAETIVPDDASIAVHRYTDRYITFPSAKTKNTIWIWLETSIQWTDNKDNDLCFWDNIYLQGVLQTTAPTLSPTSYPTDAPSNNPSAGPTDLNFLVGAPTKSPTLRPTKAPTDEPTKKPAGDPTKAPTHRPTKGPTDAPTKSPLDPTPSPTKDPTVEPTSSPTAATPIDPTQEATSEPSMGPTTEPSSPMSSTAQSVISKMYYRMALIFIIFYFVFQ